MSDFFYKTTNYNIIFIIVGFLVASLLPSLLGSSEESFTLIYRGAVMFISCLLLFYILVVKNNKKKFEKFIFFFIFWFLYSLRVIYDLLVADIILYEGRDINYYMLNTFGVVLLPCLSIIFINFSKLNYRLILKWVYIFLFVGLFLSLLLRGQSSVVSNRSVGDLNIGVLLYGQYGATLGLLSLFLLLESKSLRLKVIYGLGFCIGFVTIFVSASRSPLLALVLTSLITLSLKYFNVKAIILALFIGIIIYFLIDDVFLFLEQNFNSSFLFRIKLALEGNSGSRENFVGSGFQSFVNNPFFGDAMLLQNQGYKGSYPHNLIIESFMAIGFLGGSIFLLSILKGLKAFRTVIMEDINISWIALIFFQFLIFGMFSGNLYSSNIFWFSYVLLLGVSGVNTSNLKNLKL